MDFTYQALNVLILLFPGFLSSTVFRFLVYRKERDFSFAILEAVSFSMFNYLVFASIFRKSPVLLNTSSTGSETSYSITYQLSIWIILILSLAMPVILAYLINNDKLSWIFHRLKFTTRTSRANTWLDVFAEVKGYVVVNFKDGSRIYGWPMYYSNTAEEGLIYLYRPFRVVAQEEKNVYEDMHVQGIFIVNSDVEFIQFLNNKEDS